MGDFKKNIHEQYQSFAKIMLSGEYLVLKGAEALSLPLILSQKMNVKTSEGLSSLHWRSLEFGKSWFEAHYSLPEFAIGNTSDFEIAKQLREFLQAAKNLNEDFLREGIHYEVETDMDFKMNWGLGSSSSLIVNIAKWAKIDPFKLHFKLSSGSGYDVATAMSDQAILYSLKEGKPWIKKVSFDPVFKNNLYFVYLGQKRDSKEAVSEYLRANQLNRTETIDVSRISQQLLKSNSLTEFILLLREHDAIISKLLKTETIYEKRFHDFHGYVKSLGAWGGDFALIASSYPLDYVSSYLKRKKLLNFYFYEDFILSKNPQ